MKKNNIFFFDEKGGGLVEYTLIIVLVALAVIATMNPNGTRLSEDSSIISKKL